MSYLPWAPTTFSIIDNVSVDVSGKDGFKTRSGPKGVHVRKVVTNKTALRGVDVESDDTVIESIQVTNAGFDSVGTILGHPAKFSGGNAAGESIQTDPGGLAVFGCAGVTLGSVRIENVFANPATLAEGHGIHLAKASNVRITGSVSECDGNGIRIAGSSNFDLNVDVANPCRKGPQKQAILLTADDAGENRNGSVRSDVRQDPGGPALYAAYISDAACNMHQSVRFNPSEFPEGIKDKSSRNC